MFRPEIKVLDCTIRDGGLVNKHKFSHEFVRKVYKALAEAGVDSMEIGYKNSDKLFSRSEYGPWKFCDDEDIRKVREGIENGPKVAVMVDIGRADLDAIKDRDESPFEMVRVAAYVKDIDKAIAHVNRFNAQGYETTVNIMASSRDRGPELDEALAQIQAESKADVVYLVDSFGHYYQEQVDAMMVRYKDKIVGREIGFHGHNNMQLAFGNTIEAIMRGANFVDGTLFGIGRGAGNCTTELLLSFLKNPKYDIRPVLDVVSTEMVPMMKKGEIEWGYIIPLMISGAFNVHPKDAIAWRANDNPERDNYRAFWEKTVGTGLD